MKYADANVKKIDKKIPELIKKSKKGIFLFGGTGTGKTYAMHAIKKRIIETGGNVSLKNWVELLFELKSEIQWLMERVHRFVDEGIVMIDDLGSERQTEWSQELLYMIINRAYEKERKVFIATNLSLEEFSARYGDRIFSRLMEMCEPYEMKGEDRRI